MAELALEDRGQGRGVVDRLDVAGKLHRGVVARWHAVLVLIPVTGDVRVRAEHREDRARPLGDRLPHRVVAGEVKQHRAFAVVEEMGRDDDGQIAAGAGRDELAEVVRLEEVVPLGVVERGVVLADQHARMMMGRGGRAVRLTPPGRTHTDARMSVLAGCGAVSSALALGARGRRGGTGHPDSPSERHVGLPSVAAATAPTNWAEHVALRAYEVASS